MAQRHARRRRAARRAGDFRVAVARFGVLQGDRRARPAAHRPSRSRTARAARCRTGVLRHVARRPRPARRRVRPAAVQRRPDRDGDGRRREDDPLARRDGRDDLASAARAAVADAAAGRGARLPRPDVRAAPADEAEGRRCRPRADGAGADPPRAAAFRVAADRRCDQPVHRAPEHAYRDAAALHRRRRASAAHADRGARHADPVRAAARARRSRDDRDARQHAAQQPQDGGRDRQAVAARARGGDAVDAADRPRRSGHGRVERARGNDRARAAARHRPGRGSRRAPRRRGQRQPADGARDESRRQRGTLYAAGRLRDGRGPPRRRDGRARRDRQRPGHSGGGAAARVQAFLSRVGRHRRLGPRSRDRPRDRTGARRHGDARAGPGNRGVVVTVRLPAYR